MEIIMIDAANIYRLAEICTAATKIYTSDETGLAALESKIQELFDKQEAIVKDAGENKQAAYILCNRINDLQKSLGDSELKTKLLKTLQAIKASLPLDFLSSPGTVF